MQREIINRQPAVAGTFYPANKEKLMLNLKNLFAEASPNKNLNDLVALITPHAGYVYSGIVAASAFNQVSASRIYNNVFLIGSSHHLSFDGAAIYSEGNFITPLGEAHVNIDLCEQILSDNPDIFKSVPEAHLNEHSLEVQIPFLQILFHDNLQIIPIILATQNTITIKKIAEALSPFFNNNNLFVISTDFSHYPEYENAKYIDKTTLNAIIKNSPEYFIETINYNKDEGIPNLATSICGWSSVLMLLHITSKLPQSKYHEIKYMNSGDVQYGDKNHVVGYHAIVVTSNFSKESNSINFSRDEQNFLLRIARNSIEEFLKNGKRLEIDTGQIPSKLLSPAGAFVTLTKSGKLRGCIGQFHPDQPLFKVIQEMAISASTTDYRFNKVSLTELEGIVIEISVLSPMRKIRSIGEIELGKHGIFIKKGNSSGTFLPQVAEKTNWSKEEYLGHCSRDKAGIGWDGWRDAEIYIYEAIVFCEK